MNKEYNSQVLYRINNEGKKQYFGKDGTLVDNKQKAMVYEKSYLDRLKHKLHPGWEIEDLCESLIESSFSDKVTGKTWAEFVSNVSAETDYDVDSAYTRKYDQWIELINKDTSKIFDAEVTQYSDGSYELMLYNIIPSRRVEEEINIKKGNKMKLTEDKINSKWVNDCCVTLLYVIFDKLRSIMCELVNSCVTDFNEFTDENNIWDDQNLPITAKEVTFSNVGKDLDNSEVMVAIHLNQDYGQYKEAYDMLFDNIKVEIENECPSVVDVESYHIGDGEWLYIVVHFEPKDLLISKIKGQVLNIVDSMVGQL